MEATPATTNSSEQETQGIPISEVVTDDVLKPLVQDDEERENIKQELKALETLRQLVLLRSASKTKSSADKAKEKLKKFQKTKLELDDGLFKSVSVGAVYPPPDKLEFVLAMNPTTITSPSFDNPYDTGLSTTARLLPQVPLPLVTSRLVEELAFDWQGLPNLNAIKTHFLREGRLEFEVAFTILEKTRDMLSKLPNLLSLSAPMYVFGDIHGQFFDMIEVLKRILPPKGNEDTVPPCLFLGDYVDRGVFSTEVILYLFSMKLRYPNQIHLLKGNHETRSMTKSFNFKKECLRKYNKKFYKLAMQCFDQLPLAATLQTEMGTLFCVHGGISPDLEVLSDINEIERVTDPIYGLYCDLLWADPVPLPHKSLTNDEIFNYTTRAGSLDFEINTTRGCSVHFGLVAIRDFLGDNNLIGIIRGHEVQQKGYHEHYFGHELSGLNHIPALGPLPFPPLLTVFSAPNYCESENKGAVLNIQPNEWSVIQYDQCVDIPYALPNFADGINFSLGYLSDCVAKAYTFMLAQVVYVLCTDEITSRVDSDMYHKVVRLLKISTERRIQREQVEMAAAIHQPFALKASLALSVDALNNAGSKKKSKGLFHSQSTNF
eukprot:TRINITY_DN3806_c0_g1_i1.p1 TRINITY_DN3806_c0_g1~~TRINITY_DN3806_c0_g1_i1.p1  ORF type:complete len:604 (-),score=114.24 TRINITY_DN3806_c0_g1_i1:50-1861(-)